MKEKGMTTINLKKFNRNKELVKKEQLEDEDFSEIARLQMFLSAKRNFQAADCPGSANGTFYCQSEFE